MYWSALRIHRNLRDAHTQILPQATDDGTILAHVGGAAVAFVP